MYINIIKNMIQTQTKILFIILYDDNYYPIFRYHLVHFACIDAPCKNGATCLPNASAGGVKCICTAEWKGLFCESKCELIASNCPDSAEDLIQQMFSK